MQENLQQNSENQMFFVQQPVNKSNGIGIAGFVLALLGLLLGWVPILGWILWLLGLILSGVGMTRKPRGLAIAGLVISLIGLVILIFLATVFALWQSLNKG